jgi:hypothetical protein
MIAKMRKYESGIALLVVLIIMTGVILISLSMLYMVRMQMALGAQHAGIETDRYIAEAGIYKYLWNLNQNSLFYQKDTSLTDPANPMPVNDTPQAVLGWCTMVSVPPSSDHPYVDLRCSGWLAKDSPNYDPNNPHTSGNIPPTDPMKITTLEVWLQKKEFTNYVVFDGDMLQQNGQPAWYGTGEEVHGPLHSNKTLQIGGNPTFDDIVEYGTTVVFHGTSNPTYVLNSSTPPPDPTYPRKVAAMQIPTTNSQLKYWADVDDTAQHAKHLSNSAAYPQDAPIADFPGRSQIYLHGDEFDIIYWDPVAKAFVTKNDLPIPPDQVIYVSSAAGATNSKWDVNTGNVFVAGKLSGQLTIVAAHDIWITPYNPTVMPFPATLAAKTAAYTGGLTYQDDTINGTASDDSVPDMLGLVATNSVHVIASDWPSETVPYSQYVLDDNPYYSGMLYQSGGQPDICIRAAVAAQNGIYECEGWNGGPEGCNGVKGHVNLSGSELQQFVGVTWGSGGYRENDIYDARLKYETPPHFLEPANAGWQILKWISVPVSITLTPATLPDGTYNQPYYRPITASEPTVTGGETPSYTFYSKVTLPPGLSLNDAGVLSGTPTQAGQFTFAIYAVDQNGYIGSRGYTMTVNSTPILVSVITPPGLPSGTANELYSGASFNASGGVAPYTFSITDPGDLPPGLSLSNTDQGNADNEYQLTGTPTTGGSYTFTITATDANNYTGSNAYSLTIATE